MDINTDVCPGCNRLRRIVEGRLCSNCARDKRETTEGNFFDDRERLIHRPDTFERESDDNE